MIILRPEHQLTQQFMEIHTVSTVFIKLNLIPKIPILIPDHSKWITKRLTGSIYNTSSKTTQKHAFNNTIHNILQLS